MVGLVVATHGRLAEELLRTAEGIVGAVAAARAVSISADRPMEEAREDLAGAIRAVDQGEGTLVLTDMFGGTPANLALTFLDGRVEVLTGVNLPMVVKFAATRGDGLSLRATAELLEGYGQKNIALASELLRQRTASGGRP
ncbi:MAG TPA: PTS fructose transporter subunit IIA [Anaeromyxobacteraceae bacterium]|nr:PTS fructose transporter subunit IIA [Anaeromyxobacteraceae bacterium]